MARAGTVALLNFSSPTLVALSRPFEINNLLTNCFEFTNVNTLRIIFWRLSISRIWFNNSDNCCLVIRRHHYYAHYLGQNRLAAQPVSEKRKIKIISYASKDGLSKFSIDKMKQVFNTLFMLNR